MYFLSSGILCAYEIVIIVHVINPTNRHTNHLRVLADVKATWSCNGVEEISGNIADFLCFFFYEMLCVKMSCDEMYCDKMS